MKISLDELMNDHRAESFDNALPPMGHFERFEERLDRRVKKNNERWRWLTMLGTAAAIASLLIIFQYTRPEHPQSINTDSVMEVANFYELQLTDEIEKIEKELNGMEETSRREIVKDIETMKNEFREFNTGQTEMTEEDHIAMIILRYNVQLESLRHIRSILAKTEHHNNEHNM